MSDTEKAYERATAALSTAQVAYNKILDSFRSTIKNDMVSITASAEKCKAANAKLFASYAETISMLTGADMEAAIANAERFAVALKAVSELRSHSITFAVLDKKGDK